MVVSAQSGAEDLLRFIDASPSPFHVVAEAATRLQDAGFAELDLSDRWPAAPGGYYVRRSGALVAWLVPAGSSVDTPFRIIGAHSDSPNLRLKPHADAGRAGWQQLAVEVYGGALLNSWLDRDLGLSGRVAVDGPAGPEYLLFRVERPLARVPQLAIHLDRGVNEGGLVLNKQQHLAPVWGTGSVEVGGLAGFVADELGVDPGRILAYDLMLHDLTPSTFLGRDRDLIAAPRIDNQASCHAAVSVLAKLADDLSLGEVGSGSLSGVAVACLFDHEEVGSGSVTGADGPLLADVLERTVLCRGGGREEYLRALASSICVSADGAHGTHPNYVERHEPGHLVAVNGGPVLKSNSDQRYATDSTTGALLLSMAAGAGVPMQHFVTRSDLACGSTIGPITAARLGVATVDVGIPMLSMHSARELCGAADIDLFHRLLATFLTSDLRP